MHVDGDGTVTVTVTEGTYPGEKGPTNGWTSLELPSRRRPLEWAAKIAVACRCAQEVPQFQDEPTN